MRYYGVLWKVVHKRERRRNWLTEMQVEQLAALIAMTANTGNLRWDEPREPKEWLPHRWDERHGKSIAVPETEESLQARREAVADQVRAHMMASMAG